MAFTRREDTSTSTVDGAAAHARLMDDDWDDRPTERELRADGESPRYFSAGFADPWAAAAPLGPLPAPPF
jgi:hypothetical protein